MVWLLHRLDWCVLLLVENYEFKIRIWRTSIQLMSCLLHRPWRFSNSRNSSDSLRVSTSFKLCFYLFMISADRQDGWLCSKVSSCYSNFGFYRCIFVSLVVLIISQLIISIRRSKEPTSRILYAASKIAPAFDSFDDHFILFP